MLRVQLQRIIGGRRSPLAVALAHPALKQLLREFEADGDIQFWRLRGKLPGTGHIEGRAESLDVIYEAVARGHLKIRAPLRDGQADVRIPLGSERGDFARSGSKGVPNQERSRKHSGVDAPKRVPLVLHQYGS